MKPFDGLSILLLEDEYLIALDAEQILQNLGVKQVEIVNTIAEATKAAEQGGADLAILDVNINGEMSFPVADILHRKGTAVVFASGYDLRKHPIAGAVHLTKPYTSETLKDALLCALRSKDAA